MLFFNFYSSLPGENFGLTPTDLLGVNILGADCLLTAEWKSPNKIIALCPAKEGKGDIIIATTSGGLGTCNVQIKVILKLNLSNQVLYVINFISAFCLLYFGYSFS